MIKVKKLNEKAELPRYAHDGDSCFDLFATGDVSWEYNNGILNATVPIGLAFEIPYGYTMFVFSRSGHGFKYGVTLANCTGVIDSTYRGEVVIKLTSHNRVFDIERGVKVVSWTKAQEASVALVLRIRRSYDILLSIIHQGRT